MLKPLFYTRSFGLNQFQASWLVVESARWAMVGGPDVAKLSGVNAGRLDLARALGLLRCGVELVDESGQAAWWGYVSSVELRQPGGLVTVCDLDQMNNRVKVSYTGLNTVLRTGSGAVQYTDWGDELTSQGIYGVKEKIINIQAVSAALAALKRGLEIGENGFPQASPMVKTVGQNDVIITLKGWWSTAGWRYYSQPDGLIQDLEETGVQNFGNSTGDVRLYQSILIPVSNWRVECLWLSVSITRTPGDSMQVDLYADSGGSPSGASLASSVLAATELSHSFAWKCFVFSSPPVLAAGTYWIKVSRTASTHAGWAYRVKTDINETYEDGVMWLVGTPIAADMSFQLVGGNLTTDQITAMAGAGAGGQFLAGVRVENSSGIYTNQFRLGTTTALQEIVNLLAAGDVNGTRLLAEVTQDRYLRIYTAPVASSAVLYVNGAGLLVNSSGNLLPAWTPAAGRWAVAAAAWGEGGSQYQQVKDRVMLGAVDYDPISGGLKAGARRESY